MQDLIDRVRNNLAWNLRTLAEYNGYALAGWNIDQEADALAAIAVGHLIRGTCGCFWRLHPPLGRDQDYPLALERCERQHGIGVADLVRAGLIIPPLELRSDYLGSHLTASISPGGQVQFNGVEYAGLFSAARAARELVTGPWKYADHATFWSRQNAAGRWVAINEKTLTLATIPPPGTSLRGVVVGRVLQAEIGKDGKVWFDREPYDTLTLAAVAARESVVQEETNTNGWTFWSFQENGAWIAVDILRERFWQAFLATPLQDRDAYWAANTASGRDLNACLKKAVVGGVFPDQAREVSRAISFPLIEMPNGQGLEWGDVLHCDPGDQHTRPEDKGCGNDEVIRTCPICRPNLAEEKETVPRIGPTFRIFPQERRTPRRAFRCSQCDNYWVAKDPHNPAEACPRCRIGRPAMNGPNPRTTKVWIPIHVGGGDDLNRLEDIGDDLD